MKANRTAIETVAIGVAVGAAIGAILGAILLGFLLGSVIPPDILDISTEGILEGTVICALLGAVVGGIIYRMSVRDAEKTGWEPIGLGKLALAVLGLFIGPPLILLSLLAWEFLPAGIAGILMLLFALGDRPAGGKSDER